jgi:hypothetical protein
MSVPGKRGIPPHGEGHLATNAAVNDSTELIHWYAPEASICQLYGFLFLLCTGADNPFPS